MVSNPDKMSAVYESTDPEFKWNGENLESAENGLKVHLMQCRNK